MRKQLNLVLFVSVLFGTTLCRSQVNTDLRPQVKSPEVNKFEQYMNMPVNLVSGTPQVSIPIYTLEYGGMKLPISLDYDASGVKVESIASSVGQNWSLNVGGVVSRIVKGAPDEGNPYRWTAQSSEEKMGINGYYKDFGLTKLESSLNSFSENVYSSDEVDNRAIQFYKWNNDLASGLRDSQPDLFYFNSPEGNSKFVFNDKREVVYLENTDFTIKENNPTGAEFISWNLISPNGIKYKFGLDGATGLQGSGNAAESSYNLDECSLCGGLGGAVNHFIVNSWFLTEIATSVNNNKIQLNYVDNNYKQVVNNIQSKYTENCKYYSINGSTVEGIGCWDEEYQYTSFAQSPYVAPLFDHSNDIGMNMQAKPNSSHIVHSKLISKITAGTIEINFIYSLRDDLLHEWDATLTSGQKLEEIQIKDNGVCIKKFLFGYTPTYSTEVSNNSAVTETTRKRFFLVNLKELSCDNTLVKPYSFVYNSTLLPNRLSYAQDKWGFYNGKLTNNTQFPSYKFFQDSQIYADRSVNVSYAKAGILEKIVYPTKGSVNFEYESHQADTPTDYKYNPIPSSVILTDFQPQPQGLFSSPSNTTTFIYNLNSNQILSFSSNLIYPNPIHSLGSYCNDKTAVTAAEIIDNISNQTVANISYTPNVSTTKKIYLDPLKFVVGRTYTVKVYGTECYHNMTTLGIHDITPIFSVGGLRVSKITHKNFDDSVIKTVNYSYFSPKIASNPQKAYKIEYNYYSNLTSLNNILSFHNIDYLNKYGKAQANYNWDSTSESLYFISSGVDFYDLNFMGPQISYGKVIETDGNGKIEHNFNKYQSYLDLNGGAIIKYPASPKIQSILAGEKGSVINWNDTNQDVKTNRFEYNYSTTNTTIKAINTLSYGASNQIPGVLFNTYTLQGQTKTLKTETETTSLKGQDVTVTKDYEYTGVNHYQPTKITTTNSKGAQLITKMYYPNDLQSESLMQNLIDQNRKSTPVRTENYNGTTKLSEQKTIYAKDASTANLVLPKSIYAAKFPNSLATIPGIGTLERKVTSDYYDTSGNLTQYTPEGGSPVSIVWGYNKTQPIAKIENATNAQLVSALGVSDFSAITEAQLASLNNLRTNSSFTSSMITTYTYQPLVGVTSITDPKGDTVYYTYDGLGRLQYVKDAQGKLLTDYQYHYKN